jgi:putative peptidoglycan lipid II flippase
LKETFSFGLRLVMFITLPATVGLIVCRQPIISVLFQRGAFTAAAVQSTASALLFYAVGLFAYAGVKVVVPVFYSFQDTKTPVRIAIISMIVNTSLNFILMWPLKHGGLALATSLSSILNLSLLLYCLRKKMGRLGGRKIFISCLKISIASILAGVGAWIVIRQVNFTILSRSSAASVLMVIICVSILFYALISYLLRSSEMAFFIDMVRKKRSFEEKREE